MLGNYIDGISPQLWICLWITFYLWMWIEASQTSKIRDTSGLA